jgi:hypothetical protein
LGTNPGDVALSANGGGTNGDAGTINIDPSPGNITIDSSSAIDAQALGTDGNGGELTLTAGPTLNLSPSLSTTAAIDIDGMGTGNGGSLTIEAPGGVPVSGSNNLAISAQAQGSGDGGSVSISASSDVNLNGSAINVDAGTGSGSTGQGGTITVTTTGDVNTTGTLDAAGGCDGGNAGTVSLTGNDMALGDIGSDSSVCMANRATWAASNAKPRAASGEYNGLDIMVTGQNLLGESASHFFNANARGPGGAGGTITVENTYGVTNLNSFSPNAFSAQGNGTGAGGSVTIAKTKPIFDVNRVINVNAGSAVTDVTTNDGTITLNGQACRQWLIGSNPDLSGTPRNQWPLSYWNCSSVPGTQSTIDLSAPTAAVNTAISNDVRSSFTSNNVVLYTFANADGFNAFFSDSLLPDVGGLTQQVGSHIYSAPWESGSQGGLGTVQYTAAQYLEVTAHELGHDVDLSLGTTGKPSVSGTYKTYMAQDINTLNYADSSFTVARLPCAATPGYSGPIPFANALNPVNVSICNADGTLNNNALNHPGDSWPNTNLGILQYIDPLWTGTQWIEPHAQLFGYSVVGDQGARFPTDQVIDNGFFPCTLSFAFFEQNGDIASGTCSFVPMAP